MDISNQSSKEGIRIVIDLKKDADVENPDEHALQEDETGGYVRRQHAGGGGRKAGDDGAEKIIEYHVDFQFEITTRKYRTLLAKEQEKREVQEGLIKACDD